MQIKKTTLAFAALFSTGLAASSGSTTKTSSATKTSSTNSIPSSCSLGSSATATAQTDLDDFAACTTLVGNLTITGELGSAALANVEKLDGSLNIYNATYLSTFAADSLTTITGSLILQDLTVLSSASFGSLETVDTITLLTLPAIATFATNLQKASNIEISDTTLESVDGFATLKEVSVLDINNNRYLTSFNSALESVSEALQISFNGQSTEVSFDNLVWANNITLNDVESATFASLQTVNASLGFINNTISNITLAKLTKVGQSLSFTSNDELTVLDCSNLTSIGGGFVVANNTLLKDISGFSKLQTIGGAIEVTGNFSTLDLSSLKSVRGGADIESSASNFSCSALNKLQSSGAIQGDSYVCRNGFVSSSVSSASQSSTRSSSGSRSSSDSSSNSTSSSSGAAAGQYIPVTSFIGGFAAVVIALL